MKLTADILNRFAQARELDQRAKAIAAERGGIVTTETYREAIGGEPCGCQHGPAEPHSCPYVGELHSNEDSPAYCRCCESRTNQCARDI